MIDAILSLHMNPLTCGVAKWNHALAEQLGVPCRPLSEFHGWGRPLVSIKTSELSPAGPWPGNGLGLHKTYDLFLHDSPFDWAGGSYFVKHARRIFVADPIIGHVVRKARPDVVTAFCPATLRGDASRGAYRVLVFGMAHKLNEPKFRALKAELDREHPDYTIELSTAVHEGSPWDEALEQSTMTMRAIFGDKLRVLGFLGDDALAKELQECDAVAAYFTPALRANNTSAWAALAAGKKLYTNTDEYSPPLDVTAHSWEKLIEILHA